MTTDESWDLLTEICHNANNDNFIAIIELVKNKLEELDWQHYDAIIFSVSLVPEFIKEHSEFLHEFCQAFEKSEYTLKLSGAFRFAFLKTLLNEQENNSSPQ